MPGHLMPPPIRTALVNNPDGTPLTQKGNGDNSNSSNGGPISTEKQWWYYWRDTGRQVNANTAKLDGLVTQGAHADRPDPANAPNGALYVESDRGVIYCNEGGVWQYVAGVMYGTLSPDQRPADLAVNDAGFEFRSIDAASANTGRDFVWSQTAWVEITQVLYGTHAARPANS